MQKIDLLKQNNLALYNLKLVFKGTIIRIHQHKKKVIDRDIKRLMCGYPKHKLMECRVEIEKIKHKEQQLF